MIKMHIGFDDTDSPMSGCTTYIAALLVEKLCRLGVSFIDYPNLVRLNPNVPWKTRGNGALCLRIACNKVVVEETIETVVETIERNADLSDAGTNPGIVFLFNNIPKEIRDFANRTIQRVVKLKQALKLARSFRAEVIGFKTGRGIIGGLAAIGEPLEGDHTYEIIAYRTCKNRGTPRRVDTSSIEEMNRKTTPFTFNNVDPEEGRVLITPRGPDPILYGIRGETVEAVREAHELVRTQETVERWVIFRTNHGTDSHLRRVSTIADVQPYNPVVVRGAIAMEPQVIPGGHVIFPIEDENGQIDCAAYEPTGSLREVARNLIVGDVIEACGGVRPISSRHPITVNLEKILILKLAPKIFFHNPKCPHCGKHMKSMGTMKGFRCKKCGYRSSKLRKMTLEKERNLKKRLYITSPRSQRHLTKPLCRYGREKSGIPKKLIKDWHFPLAQKLETKS